MRQLLLPSNYTMYQSSTFPLFQPESPKKQSNWHKKHEDIIATPRAVKTFALTIKDGGSLPPPPPPTYDQGNAQLQKG